MDNEIAKGLSLCDSCYQAADQEQAATSDACDVCTTRAKVAELRDLLSAKHSRIEDLEAQLEALKQQVKDSESQPLSAISVLEAAPADTDDVVVAAARTALEAGAAADSRPHMMLVGDNLFGKLRKAPHFIYEHLGRIPRLVSRTKPDAGVLEMTRNALDSLSNEKVAGRMFHILWFGGLHDTTLEDYERKPFLEKLVKSLNDLRNHERVLSVNWCTLPESAHNAEAREINEYITTWINENQSGVDEKGEIVRLVDLRYISRRDATMEVNEAMWTPKGSKLVSESLKKILTERLEFTQKELDGIEASSKAMLEAREKKEANKKERKAKYEANLQEQQLRKQQKLAKQVLLKGGHSIPGSASTSAAVTNGSNTVKARPTAPRPAKPGPRNNHPRPKKGLRGPGAVVSKRKAPFADSFPTPKRAYQSDYPVNPPEAFPVRENRTDSYFGGWNTKRNRVASDDNPYGFASSSEPYYRREDYYRRSPPVSNSSPYDNNRFLPATDRTVYNAPDDQVRRLQWEAFDRLRP